MKLFTSPDETGDGILVRDLRRDGFWYLATPYSRFPGGTHEAFEKASIQAAFLIASGLPVFCPIAHTHPIALHGGIDQKNHDIWLPADQPFMDAAVGLIVCMMDSWLDSYGIGYEIKAFKKRGASVLYLPPIE